MRSVYGFVGRGEQAPPCGAGWQGAHGPRGPGSPCCACCRGQCLGRLIAAGWWHCPTRPAAAGGAGWPEWARPGTPCWGARKAWPFGPVPCCTLRLALQTPAMRSLRLPVTQKKVPCWIVTGRGQPLHAFHMLVRGCAWRLYFRRLPHRFWYVKLGPDHPPPGECCFASKLHSCVMGTPSRQPGCPMMSVPGQVMPRPLQP